MQLIRFRSLWVIALFAGLIAAPLIRPGIAADVQAGPATSAFTAIQPGLVSQEATPTATGLDAGALLGSPPLIDGIESEAEWDSAGNLSFQSENFGFVSLQAMIDETTLYLAVRVADTALSPGDFAGFTFDNSGNGVTDDRDDSKGRFVPRGYQDMHAALDNWLADDIVQHGEATVRHDTDITHANGVGESNYFEFAFPLNSGDPFDFQTWPGGTLMMCVMVAVDAKILEQHPTECIGEEQGDYLVLNLPDLGLPTPTPTPTITPTPSPDLLSTVTPPPEPSATTAAPATVAAPEPTQPPLRPPTSTPNPTPSPTSTSVVPTPTAAPTPAATKAPTPIVEATPTEVATPEATSEPDDPDVQPGPADGDSDNRTQTLLGIIGALALLAGYAVVRSRLRA